MSFDELSYQPTVPQAKHDWKTVKLKTLLNALSSLSLIKRVQTFATIAVALVTFAANANAEIYTLTFDGNSNLVPVKSYGLPSFKGIKKIKIKFESSKPILPGICSGFQSGGGLAGSWSLVYFTDGSNTYTKAKGFSSPLSKTWAAFNWNFEACLDSASQLTIFRGGFTADAGTTPTDTLFENEFSYGTAPFTVVVGYGTQTSYSGQYGLSIGINEGYNYQTATTFDAYNGNSPTILYKP
jgi:hypothetical protein